MRPRVPRESRTRRVIPRESRGFARHDAYENRNGIIGRNIAGHGTAVDPTTFSAVIVVRLWPSHRLRTRITVAALRRRPSTRPFPFGAAPDDATPTPTSVHRPPPRVSDGRRRTDSGTTAASTRRSIATSATRTIGVVYDNIWTAARFPTGVSRGTQRP